MREIAPLLEPWRDPDGPPLGIALEIGLPAGSDLLVHHDLDNFLEPLATELASPRLYVAAATKTRGGPSRLTIGPVVPREPDHSDWQHARLRADGLSAPGRRALGRALADQAAPLPWGPVALDIALRTGAARSWAGAWKPVIDSLVGILGRRHGAGEFDIEDGRVVELTLHREIDPALGHSIEVDVRWRLLASHPGGPRLSYDVAAEPPQAPSRVTAAPAPGVRHTPSRHLGAEFEAIATLERLRTIQTTGSGFIAITDTANSPRLHRAGCEAVKEANFHTKAIVNGARNGQYLWTAAADHARARWPRLREHDCV